KSNLQALGRRACTSFFQPIGGNVATGDLCSRPGRNERELARAATDIKQPGSRFYAEPVKKILGVLLHEAREKVVVSGRPYCLQARLELLKVLSRLCLFHNRIHSRCLLSSTGARMFAISMQYRDIAC